MQKLFKASCFADGYGNAYNQSESSMDQRQKSGRRFCYL